LLAENRPPKRGNLIHVIIKVLTALVSDPSSFSAADARREHEREISIFSTTDEDRLALTFISEASEAFREFTSDPASALTRNRLGIAFDALGKVSTIGPGVTDAVRPEIGKTALRTVLGPFPHMDASVHRERHG
jgi:hypothetical protein